MKIKEQRKKNAQKKENLLEDDEVRSQVLITYFHAHEPGRFDVTTGRLENGFKSKLFPVSLLQHHRGMCKNNGPWYCNVKTDDLWFVTSGI